MTKNNLIHYEIADVKRFSFDAHQKSVLLYCLQTYIMKKCVFIHLVDV